MHAQNVDNDEGTRGWKIWQEMKKNIKFEWDSLMAHKQSLKQISFCT